MEVKVICDCGTKFKFDVEPERGGMPVRVKCPSCGVDTTQQANEFIRQKLPAAPTSLISAAGMPPVAPVPAAPASPPPIPASAQQPLRPSPPAAAPPVIRLASSAAAAAMQPPSPPAGLRVSRSSGADPTGAPVVDLSLPRNFKPIGPNEDTRATSRSVGGRKSSRFPFRFGGGSGGGKSKMAAAGTALVVLYGIWTVGAKWFNRISDVGSLFGGSGEEEYESNLWHSDCVVLYVRQTNSLEVVQACQRFWKDTYNKTLNRASDQTEEWHAGEYLVFPPHNGFVQFIGSLEWPAERFEALASHLSKHFHTLVFEARETDFSGAYHFGVYEQGERKFHAQMEINPNGLAEAVTTEHGEWAVAHGFKSDEDGFKSFSIEDADNITKQLGMRMWDFDPENVQPPILLREN